MTAAKRTDSSETEAISRMPILRVTRAGMARAAAAKRPALAPLVTGSSRAATAGSSAAPFEIAAPTFRRCPMASPKTQRISLRRTR